MQYFQALHYSESGKVILFLFLRVFELLFVFYFIFCSGIFSRAGAWYHTNTQSTLSFFVC